MPFAKSSPYHRSRSQIEPARRTNQRPVQDPNSNGERALVIPLSHGRKPSRPAAMTMSAMTVKAVTRISHFAEHTLPDLMVAVFSWIITETLAGCTAYAESLYPIPAAPEAVEAAPDETPRRRAADHLSLVSIHAGLGVVNCEQPTLAPRSIRPTPTLSCGLNGNEARFGAAALRSAISSPHAPCEFAGPARGGRRLPNCAGSTIEPCATSACRPATSNTSYGTTWDANDAIVAVDTTDRPVGRPCAGRGRDRCPVPFNPARRGCDCAGPSDARLGG